MAEGLLELAVRVVFADKLMWVLVVVLGVLVFGDDVECVCKCCWCWCGKCADEVVVGGSVVVLVVLMVVEFVICYVYLEIPSVKSKLCSRITTNCSFGCGCLCRCGGVGCSLAVAVLLGCEFGVGFGVSLRRWCGLIGLLGRGC